MNFDRAAYILTWYEQIIAVAAVLAILAFIFGRKLNVGVQAWRVGVFSLFFLAWLGMMASFAVDHSIGGTAANGKVEDGRYYVGEHGRYTEVTGAQFVLSTRYTRWTIGSTFLTFLPALLTGFTA